MELDCMTECVTIR